MKEEIAQTSHTGSSLFFYLWILLLFFLFLFILVFTTKVSSVRIFIPVASY
jgi:hypothetical protein